MFCVWTGNGSCLMPVQIIGAIFGALLVSGLMPKTHVGMGDGAPGKALSILYFLPGHPSALLVLAC